MRGWSFIFAWSAPPSLVDPVSRASDMRDASAGVTFARSFLASRGLAASGTPGGDDASSGPASSSPPASGSDTGGTGAASGRLASIPGLVSDGTGPGAGAGASDAHEARPMIPATAATARSPRRPNDRALRRHRLESFISQHSPAEKRSTSEFPRPGGGRRRTATFVCRAERKETAAAARCDGGDLSIECLVTRAALRRRPSRVARAF